MVAIICLDSLSFIKSSLQTIAEDCEVVEIARLERTIDPHNLTGADAEINFVAKGGLLLELVGREGWSLLPDVAINAIDTDVCVMHQIELPVPQR
jgi:hypothetical protein